MKDPVRIAITGGAGQISYSLIFRIAAGDMLGPDQPVILQLLEIPQAMDALNGVPFLCVVNIRVCRRNIEVTEDDELFVLPQLILQETAQRIEPVELVSVFLGTDCLAIRHI